jgi:hypothetical protein
VEQSTFSIVSQDGYLISIISIIGTGNMARAIGALAAPVQLSRERWR